MDLREKSDNIGGVDEILAAGKTVGKIAGNVRNKAKAKKAAKIAASGGYASLTPFQKSLIPVPTEIQKAAQAAGVTTDDIKAAPAAAPAAGQYKKFIPYIIGALIIGIAIYFFVKHK
jgi:hypothetical protein